MRKRIAVIICVAAVVDVTVAWWLWLNGHGTLSNVVGFLPATASIIWYLTEDRPSQKPPGAPPSVS